MSLDSYKINVFGSKVGVLTIFDSSCIENNYLSVFHYDGKSSFELLENTTSFTKKDVENLHTVIINYASDFESSRAFQLNDPVEMSIFNRLENEDTITNRITSDQKMVATFISKNDKALLIQIKKDFIKDHHFESFNNIGLSVLEIYLPTLWSNVKVRLNSNESIVVNDEEHNRYSINALGILAGFFIFDCIESNQSLTKKENVLKSYAKRVLLKVVPVIFILLIANYFYFNYLNNDLFEIQQEKASVENILGDKLINNKNQEKELIYQSELQFPTQLNRPFILNSLLDSHIEGIVYDRIIMDDQDRNENDKYFYGTIIIQFHLNNSALVNEWIKKINRIEEVSSINLESLSKGYKGVSEGELIIKYK